MQDSEIIHQFRAWVKPFYETFDLMHNIEHVDRLYKKALQLNKIHNENQRHLGLAAYCHGIIDTHRLELQKHFAHIDIDDKSTNNILQAAEESLPDSKATSLLGKILHDAHLTEGGEAYLITKSLVTGSVRDQTLRQTIDFVEQNILGKRRCYLPEAQVEYERMESFARLFIVKLDIS